MKLVLSRKGFDSSSGGGPSPVLPDGRMVSLPIPERRPSPSSPRYDELHLDGLELGPLLRSLHPRFDVGSAAHLDPDIRSPNGRPGLAGQAGAAAAHLRNQGVGPGDLLLYFGLFREAVPDSAGDYRFNRSLSPFHALWGYLQVERVLDAGAGETVPGAPTFPHFTDPARGRPNHVLVAAERLSFDPSRRGWGTFRFRPALRLTALDGRGVSWWRLPGCFQGVRLTHHPRATWGPEGDRSAGRGQEFVCTATPAIRAWARDLLTAG